MKNAFTTGLTESYDSLFEGSALQLQVCQEIELASKKVFELLGNGLPEIVYKLKIINQLSKKGYQVGYESINPYNRQDCFFNDLLTINNVLVCFVSDKIQLEECQRQIARYIDNGNAAIVINYSNNETHCEYCQFHNDLIH